MKPLVIYHAHCTDGFGAAFAAWMKLGDDAEYVACSYGDGKFDNPQDIREHVGGRDVYILDFSFLRSVMDQMFADAHRVIWLDHHKTAFEMWCDNKEYFYDEPDGRHVVLLDNNKSGALLAWEYFHPNVPVPDLIKRIDDRDRWVFQYEDSKALHAGLAAMQPWSFAQWQGLCFAGAFDRTVLRGQAILTAQDANVQSMAKQAMKCLIPAGYVVQGDGSVKPSTAFTPLYGLAVNACIHQSELGHVLATQSGTYGLIWYLAADGRVNCSLRSNGDYDVSAIAKTFGGGGHKNAAGFQTDAQTLLSWLK